MLLPALNRAKIAADSTACRSNLRQIALGMNMYVQQERVHPDASRWPLQLRPFVGASWPENNYKSSDPNPNGSWVGLSYLRSGSGVYACPAYSRMKGIFMSRTISDYIYDWTGLGSYGYNTWSWVNSTIPWSGLGGYFATGQPQPATVSPAWLPTRENQVVVPSDMISLADAPLFCAANDDPTSDTAPSGLSNLGKDLTAFYDRTYLTILRGLPVNDPSVRWMKLRHAGRWNTVFCDGHVESLRAKKLFDFSDPNVARRWNTDHQPHSDLLPKPPP